MILIADSGSTKTQWVVIQDSVNPIISTQGINPYQQTQEQIEDILNEELMPVLNALDEREVEEVHFYGAGCTKEKAPIVAEALKMVVAPRAKIRIESDMLGAARSVCGNESGIVSILGTGSNACYYDGKEMIPGNPALGFILGDEGGGAYIGKRLVGDVLKHQLPEDICKAFFEETKLTQADIIQKVYRETLPNRFLASVSPFCARHLDNPAIHDFILDCFDQFFRRNINAYKTLETTKDKNTDVVHFVGSIAHYYRDVLTEAALNNGYKVGKIVKEPIEGLKEYHSRA